MNLYYFNLHNDVEVVDEERKEFPSDGAALAYAEQAVRSLVASTIEIQGSFKLHHRLDVLNADAVLVAKVMFGDVVKVLP